MGGEKEERGGALEVGAASVADVRQTEREAVEAGNPSRAKGGRAMNRWAADELSSGEVKLVV